MVQVEWRWRASGRRASKLFRTRQEAFCFVLDAAQTDSMTDVKSVPR